MTREALRKLPEGTYRYVDFLDNDGIELDRRIRIEVAVTIRDGAFHCDFTGTRPQVRGPFNCVPSGSLAAACFAVRAHHRSDDPDQRRLLPADHAAPAEGSIVNPVEPAAVNARTATIKRITGTILGALAAGRSRTASRPMRAARCWRSCSAASAPTARPSSPAS